MGRFREEWERRQGFEKVRWKSRIEEVRKALEELGRNRWSWISKSIISKSKLTEANFASSLVRDRIYRCIISKWHKASMAS